MCTQSDIVGRRLRQGRKRRNYVYNGNEFVAKFATSSLAEAYVQAHNLDNASADEILAGVEASVEKTDLTPRELRNAKARERYAARKAAALAEDEGSIVDSEA